MEFTDTVKNNMQHPNSEGGIKVEQENPLTVGENVRMVEEEDNDSDKKIEFNEEDDIDDNDNDNEGDEEEEEEQEEDDDNNDNDNEGDKEEEEQEEDGGDGDYNEGDVEEVQEEDNANDNNDEGDKEEDDNDNDDKVVQEAWAAFIQIKVRVALLWITADVLNGWLWEVELMEKGKLFNIYMTYPSHSS